MGGRTEAVLFIPQARTPEADRRDMGRLVSACRVAMDFAAADSAELVDFRPPAARMETPIRGPYVVVHIVPRHFSSPACRGSELLYTLLPTRGIRITFDREERPENSVREVSLRRGDAVLAPAAVQVLELRRFGPQGFDEPLQRWARVTLRLEDLAPDARGRHAAVQVSVRTDAGEKDDAYEIPAEVIARAWVAALPLVAEVSESASPPLSVPRPTDGTLRSAYEKYVDGDVATAASLATARAAMPDAPRDERHWAYAVAGLSFDAMGRSDAARVAFREALATEPCLRLHPAAGPALRGLVDSLRSERVNCQTTPVRMVILRGLVAPGFGRSTNSVQAPRRGLVPLAIAGLSFGAIAMGASARDTYDRYLDWQVTPEVLQTADGDGATALYNEAEGQRALGQTLWMAAAAVYGAQLIVSVLQEARLQKRVQAVGAFGEAVGAPDAARLSVAPVQLPRGRGIALRLHW